MENKITQEVARRSLPAEVMKFENTSEITPLKEIIGQERGIEALKYGLEMEGYGYNIFIAGHSGTGRGTAIVNFLEEMSKTVPTPSDWCYVNNFKEPRRPKALALVAGKGAEFQKNMVWFVSRAKETLEEAFMSDEYSDMLSEVVKSVEDEQSEILGDMAEKARRRGFQLQKTPVGFQLLPLLEGNPVPESEFAKLPSEVQLSILKSRETLQNELRSTIGQLGEIEKKSHSVVGDLNKRVAESSISYLLQMMMELYDETDQINVFLGEVKEDLLENLQLFIGDNDDPETGEDPFRRYNVNLFVDNSALAGAPVVKVPHPTHRHIFGYIEKEINFGAVKTDFTLIRRGAAHRANGGYLIMQVEDLLSDPYAWPTLKRAIKNERLEIEEVPEPMEYLKTRIIMPEPIPFDGKIILIGSPETYNALYHQDREFKELFKVNVSFDTTMEWNEDNIEKYYSFISSLCEKEGLRHMDRSGAAAVVVHSSRLAADRDKLSTRFSEIADLIRETNYFADKDGADFASKEHVDKALTERRYRSNLYQERFEEMIKREVILIDTEGVKIGQVNGLAVLSIGGYSYGRPSRVTATIGVGREGILDIEREAKLGGPFHTKGVLIIGGYLSEMYAQNAPLSLTSRLVFEQSYGGIDGDSASSTELYAILSALSRIPIKQEIAVTGSVNQKGEVQAIGGVNEKIEGYFDVCKTKGLSGKQGVLIPYSNRGNLMLREDVVGAIEGGVFHVYPVKTIDEGIEVLTGVKAGERRPDGSYGAGTIHDLVQRRLIEMANSFTEFSR
jgi:lon-related putative ATP-dependent protease